MTKLEDIEQAIENLPPEQLARFRAWFDAFDAARFDEKIDLDAKSGNLDKIAGQALADHKAGRSRPL